MKLWRKLLWLGTLSVISTSLFLALTSSTGETKNEKTATVMSTSSLRGEVSPCG